MIKKVGFVTKGYHDYQKVWENNNLKKKKKEFGRWHLSLSCVLATLSDGKQKIT